MTYKHAKIRPAMTAIAAVIALTTTPAFAQEADPLTDADPAVETTTATAPSTSDPLSPETPTGEATAAPTETTAARDEPAEDAPAAATTTRTMATTRAPVRASTTRASAAPATGPSLPADPVAEVAAPLPAGPAPEVAMMEPPPAPVAEPAQAIDADDVLPYAGAGLGILALAGAGVALRRRKRRHEAEAAGQWDEVQPRAEPAMTAEPSADPAVHREPAFVRPVPAQPMAEPSRAIPVAAAATGTTNRRRFPDKTFIGPRQDLPEGFDLSRFGRHVQAAYMGATEDNPSLSLKNRLRRAAAMDQRERRDVEEGRMMPPAEAKPADTKPAFSQFSTGYNFRRVTTKSEPAFQF